MFDNIVKFFKKFGKKEPVELTSKAMAKERLHLVLMQDRANVSADFLDMMKQEIIDVIKKYIDVDENDIDVRLTNKMNEDGTVGAPALYANIPIAGVKSELQDPPNEVKAEEELKPEEKTSEEVKEEKKAEVKEEKVEDKVEEKVDDASDKKEDKKEDKKPENVEEKKEVAKVEEAKKEEKSEAKVEEAEVKIEDVEAKPEEKEAKEEASKDSTAEKKEDKPNANE